MENYLTAHGISRERLVLEEKSTNTKENLKFSDALTGCSQKNTGILSNNFHVYRAVKIAEKAGYESVTTDGIHLTEYGNEIIAGAWLQLFEKIKDGD